MEEDFGGQQLSFLNPTSHILEIFAPFSQVRGSWGDDLDFHQRSFVVFFQYCCLGFMSIFIVSYGNTRGSKQNTPVLLHAEAFPTMSPPARGQMKSLWWYQDDLSWLFKNKWFAGVKPWLHPLCLWVYSQQCKEPNLSIWKSTDWMFREWDRTPLQKKK